MQWSPPISWSVQVVLHLNFLNEKLHNSQMSRPRIRDESRSINKQLWYNYTCMYMHVVHTILELTSVAHSCTHNLGPIPHPLPWRLIWKVGNRKWSWAILWPNAVDGFHIFLGHLASALASVTTQHTGCCTAKTWRLHSKINTQYLITRSIHAYNII